MCKEQCFFILKCFLTHCCHGTIVASPTASVEVVDGIVLTGYAAFSFGACFQICICVFEAYFCICSTFALLTHFHFIHASDLNVT